MPSRFESTFQDRVIPAAERAFGVTVTHFRRGIASEAETVTARIEEESPQRDTAVGVENVRMMRIVVSAEVGVTADSTWNIRGDEWATHKIGTPFAEQRELWVKRRDEGTRTAKGRKTL